MNNDILSLYVELLGEPVRKTPSYRFRLCPFHKEDTPSFAVRLENGLFKCFWCWKSWNIYTLAKFLDKNLDIENKNKTFIDFKQLMIKYWYLSDIWISYLKERWIIDFDKYSFFDKVDIEKIKKETKNKTIIKNIEKKLEEFKNRLIIPIKYLDTNKIKYWRYFIGRSLDGKDPKYKNERLKKEFRNFFIWNIHNKELIITEGFFDWYLLNVLLNKSVVLLLGENKLQNLVNKTLYFFTDNDERWYNFVVSSLSLSTYYNNKEIIFWPLVFKNIVLYLNKFFKKSEIKILDQFNFLLQVKDINELVIILTKILYLKDLNKEITKENIEKIQINYDIILKYKNFLQEIFKIVFSSRIDYDTGLIIVFFLNILQKKELNFIDIEQTVALLNDFYLDTKNIKENLDLFKQIFYYNNINLWTEFLFKYLFKSKEVLNKNIENFLEEIKWLDIIKIDLIYRLVLLDYIDKKKGRKIISDLYNKKEDVNINIDTDYFWLYLLPVFFDQDLTDDKILKNILNIKVEYLILDKEIRKVIDYVLELLKINVNTDYIEKVNMIRKFFKENDFINFVNTINISQEKLNEKYMDYLIKIAIFLTNLKFKNGQK